MYLTQVLARRAREFGAVSAFWTDSTLPQIHQKNSALRIGEGERNPAKSCGVRGG